MSRTSHRRLALALVCGGTLLAGGPASAIVPPSDCGILTVKGKRYSVKADQLRCATARTHTKRYLATRTRPTGYRCKRYGPETKLEFRCAKGARVFFAIRR